MARVLLLPSDCIFSVCNYRFLMLPFPTKHVTKRHGWFGNWTVIFVTQISFTFTLLLLERLLFASSVQRTGNIPKIMHTSSYYRACVWMGRLSFNPRIKTIETRAPEIDFLRYNRITRYNPLFELQRCSDARGKRILQSGKTLDAEYR